MNDPPYVFIVRIWQESHDAIWEWRGSVEHVPTRERIYFRHTKKLTDFVLQQTGAHMAHSDNRLSTLFNQLTKAGFGRRQR